jgi:DNA-binding XRE family transcriptional regulator
MQATTTRMDATTSGMALLRCCATMAEHLLRYQTDDEIRALRRLPRPSVDSYGHRAPRGKTALGALRKAAGLTQFAAARRIGVHDTDLARWETGDRPVPAHRVEQIAAAYGVPVADVLAAVAERRAAA